MLITKSPQNSWYRHVVPSEDIQQGEVISKFPLISPSNALMSDVSQIDNNDLLIETADLLISLQRKDVVVISQSCDIASNKIAMITICLIESFDELKSKYTATGKSNFKNWANDIIKGKNYRYFAMHLCNLVNSNRDASVVDFSSPFTVPINYARVIVKRRSNRISLVSPFRESMSNSYAATISRIAIADDDQIEHL